MEKVKIYYIITLMAVIFGLFLNYLFVIFIDYGFNFILLILGISIIPLISLIYSLFIKNKSEEFKKKFYKIFIIVNSIMIIYNLLLTAMMMIFGSITG